MQLQTQQDMKKCQWSAGMAKGIKGKPNKKTKWLVTTSNLLRPTGEKGTQKGKKMKKQDILAWSIVGLVFNLVILSGMGMLGLDEHVLHQVVFMTTLGIAFGVFAEAVESTFHAIRETWRKQGWFMTVRLFIHAIVAGGVTYFVAKLMGLNGAFVASGTLATDPLAVPMVTHSVQVVGRLQGLLWQLGPESLLNDVFGVTVVGLAKGQSISAITISIFIALGGAFVVQLLLKGLSYLVVRKGWSDTKYVRLEMSLIMIANYLAFVFGSSPIGLSAAVGLTYKPRPGRKHHHILHDLWMKIGASVSRGIIVLAVGLCPFRLVVDDPKLLGFAVTLLLLLMSARYITEKIICIFTGEKAPSELVSMLAATARLGVLNLVALEAVLAGFPREAAVMSYISVLTLIQLIPNLMIIQGLVKKAEQAE